MSTVEIALWKGDRGPLLDSFRLAEDSEQELAAYVGEGQVLVARAGDAIVGHLQLAPTGEPGRMEIKNMAVAESRRGTGIGRALVERALARCRDLGAASVVVGTGAADTGNLRFYQRQGFRMLAIERDAFGPAAGYHEEIDVDGVPLRDRVWLDQEL